MKNLAVINAINLKPYALKSLFDGKSAFSMVQDYCKSLASDILVLAGKDFPVKGIAALELENSNMSTLLAAINKEASKRPDIDSILYVHCDTPFLDLDLGRELLDMHKRYRAEYSFADGYPSGFAPEILSKRCIPNLHLLAERHDCNAGKDGLFAVIQNDINSFDIETKLSSLDLRVYRLKPVCDSKINTFSAEKLWSLGVRSAIDAIKLIPAHLELLRNIPAFLSIQTNEACPQACNYCPYPRMAGNPLGLKGFMSIDSFERIMAEAKNLWDELVVDISLWGELALHPDPAAIVESVMDKEGFSLIIETSGLGWKPGLAEQLAEKWGSRIQWIVSLDDIEEKEYEKLRDKGWEEASVFAKNMLKSAKENVHIQAVRMKENEPRLENFYRFWKQETNNVIIQKYDSFSGSLPDKAVANLAPIKRLPCWHLARDMSILLDGSVPTCKHSLLQKGMVLGYTEIAANVFDDGLDTAWKSLDGWFKRHVDEDYPETCRHCDEYYTFNA
ncbi:spiro-SPASM protein [Spirochaetota bacterium]